MALSWSGLRYIVCGAVCLAVGPLMAQSPILKPINNSTPAAGSAEDRGSVLQSVLLSDGSVIRGKVLASGGQVTVKTGNQMRSFQRHEVRLIGKDTRDLYDRLSHELPKDSTSSRLSLARWCLKHHLKPQMMEELRLVLTFDSENREALSMMERFIDDPNANRGIVIVNVPTKQTHITMRGKAFETLAGLPAPLAREFTRGVQPIIKKKCGSVRCHGGEEHHGFSLDMQLVGGSVHRQSTEKNFQAIVAQLDLKKPEESDLFTVGRAPHAGMDDPLFGKDRSSRIQLQRIYKWIVATKPHLEKVQAEQRKNEASSGEEPGLLASGKLDESNRTPNPVRTAVAETEVQQDRLQLINAETAAGKMQRQVDVLEEEGFNKQLVDELLDEIKPDQFDPNEFNRRFR